MKPYRILLLTSDKYIDAVLPYAWLLKKYWPSHPDVLVAGFTEPEFGLPDGFEFYSVGDFRDYPVERWSDALIRTLHDIPDEVFILSLEDMWITRWVYDDIVTMCYDYMKQFEYVARFDLTTDRLHAGGARFYGMLGDVVNIIWSDPASQYHLSTMPAFWRKEHLLSVLVPGETPWQVELQGTPRLSAKSGSLVVLGTNAAPLKIHLAFRSGNPGQLLLDGIPQEDIDELRGMGLI